MHIRIFLLALLLIGCASEDSSGFSAGYQAGCSEGLYAAQSCTVYGFSEAEQQEYFDLANAGNDYADGYISGYAECYDTALLAYCD